MRRAVSAVIERRRLMMALMWMGGTPMVFASRYWLMPSSSMNSSRCSPGWIGSGVFIVLLLLVVIDVVVIDDIDLHGALVGPDETDAPIVVNSDAVLSGSVAA